MAEEAELSGLFVGADHTVEMTVYTTSAHTAVQDITGWTILLDIRKLDTSGTTKLSVTGSVSGVFNATPASNTQKVTFTLTDTLLDSSIFTGDDVSLRYSIKRTDAGAEQILRFGDCVVQRVTQV